MEYVNREALLEALSLNKNASTGYGEYPDEDMEFITFHESKEKEIMKESNTKIEYEDVLE